MENKLHHRSLNKIKDFLANSSFQSFNEVCGFLGFDEDDKQFVAQIEKNQASDPKSFFLIDPISFLKFKESYSIVAVFHSHVSGDENPSEFDIKMSEACCLPFMIFSINSKKFYIYEPKNKDYDVNILEMVKGKFNDDN